MKFGKYLKAGFFNRWNLLVFLGGAAFAILSGQADVALPLVLAAEAAYVGLLSSNPKFQKYVDAHEAQATRAVSSQRTQQALARITQNLPKALLERFESLRAQCLELRQIASELRNPGEATSQMPLDQYQLTGLDRLLWIYLRLLYTQFAMARFLQKTSAEQITTDIKRLEKRLSELPGDSGKPQEERLKKTLEDNLETCRTRLTNVSKARDNYELVKLEIDRLENKIRSLSELAVNRHEPEFITGQVDQVTSSMLETEKTMNELHFATGLDQLDDEAPELLRTKISQ